MKKSDKSAPATQGGRNNTPPANYQPVVPNAGQIKTAEQALGVISAKGRQEKESK